MSPATISIATTFQHENKSAIDAFIEKQAHRERGEEYRDARMILTGDLTHDGIAETVVLYTIEGQDGSNDYIQYMAVFTQGDENLVPLGFVRVGGKGLRFVDLIAIDNNTICLATPGYGPKDAMCCPSVKGTARYVLTGSTLHEEKRGTGQTPLRRHKP